MPDTTDIKPEDWWVFRGESPKTGAVGPHQRVLDALDPADIPPWRQFDDKSDQTRGETFQPEPEEMALVNAALLLRRPLLVTGKPGTGKTSLAYAVAHELGLGKVLRWSITSRTTLKDGQYGYDAIGRLQDTPREIDDKPPIEDYLKLGPLGTAFLGVAHQGKYYPRVLLIDEIDKSDIDLPNDLLHVFEEGNFEIAELRRHKDKVHTLSTADTDETATIEEGRIYCRAFPLVIMTSNGEREFPPAFLRRCLQLRMELPEKAKLKKIVQAHLGKSSAHIDTIIDQFLAHRDKDKKDLSTDQLLNALFLLLKGIDVESKAELVDALWQSLSPER